MYLVSFQEPKKEKEKDEMIHEKWNKKRQRQTENRPKNCQSDFCFYNKYFSDVHLAAPGNKVWAHSRRYSSSTSASAPTVEGTHS